MAQTGFTPIEIYGSGTTGNTPSASNLVTSSSGCELAINYTDGKLFYKDNNGVVQVLATKGASQNSISFGTTGLTPNTATQGTVTVAGTLITSNGGTGLSSYTAGDLPYYASGTALSKLAIGTANYILSSSGTAPQWVNSINIGSGTFTSVTDSGLTSGRVTYAGTGGLLQDSANMTFNGTTLTLANDASIHGLTVGLGGGSVSSNTAVGYQASFSNTAGTNNFYGGYQTGYYQLGSYNTGVGFGSLAGQAGGTSTGTGNSALGYLSLYANTSGGYNVAVGSSALQANTTASNNTAVGYQAGYSNTAGGITAVGFQALKNNTVDQSTAFGYQAALANTTGANIVAIGDRALTANTTGDNNTASGYVALFSNTTGGSNTAYGASALFNNTTASYNTAVGYQAGYSNTTGNSVAYFGYQTGQNTTGSYNSFFGGSGSGYLVTSGAKNTIIGNYSGNQGGLDIRTSSNYIVLSDGDGNPRGIFDNNGILNVGATGYGNFIFYRSSATSAGTLIGSFANNNGGLGQYHQFLYADNSAWNSANTAYNIGKVSATGRSINAAGTVNANGADYAEYMTKAGNFVIAKGDICGIDANGKLTNVFNDAISFVVKSTNPSYVGGDNWSNEPRPLTSDGKECEVNTPEYIEWQQRHEEKRALVDRIAFAGQVPVNVTNATVGQYIVPIANSDGSISGQAISESAMTLQQYMQSVGKVISVINNVVTIIVKVS